MALLIEMKASRDQYCELLEENKLLVEVTERELDAYRYQY